ncbi:MAG: phenylalanine--tRNA ligase subunit beta [Pseudomonadales bacterium]|nr:phenylalanine--tRNA ligase subunit beta [Pseudomonadales bacterium]NIX08186.1 phenylalanine--tRNA ligase subunit beta [Pseudomonadales bacterium]
MKFSEAWLREWADPDVSRGELLDQLTMAGLEVDGVEPVAGEFTGVVLAEVVSVDAHPEADKLSVCTVNDGTQTHQVVCGAPNVRAGMISAFARVGAVLPNDFRIKAAKLRGVESQGMLCSAAELGIGEDHSGILDLDRADRVGVDLREVLSLDDVIVDLDLTPNRGDCLSVRGLAREVGVLNNVPVASGEIDTVAPVVEDTFSVEIQDPEGCPRYLGRVIRGIDPSCASPLWLTEKLRRCGLRSIDPIVDVTNFVMLELGQPMHAFDLRQLNDGIVVRRARDGERLTLLDGQELELDANALLITDGNGPVAIAGVMGGERSGIQAATNDVFLECAYFAPLAVAGTARRYALHTDASHRYERGVDFELQHTAMERATRLLLDIVGGEPGPVTEAVEPQSLPTVADIGLRERRLNRLLGTQIAPEIVDEALARLDFDITSRESGQDGVRWAVRAPSHRFDIVGEADLVEEVCRIYGYNNVPARRPLTELTLTPVPLEISPVARLKRLLAGLGYQEAITYSFVDPSLQDLFAPGADALALSNPMSSEQSVMRLNLLPGLIESLRFNVARQQDRVRIFELGSCFAPGDPVIQQLTLGGVLWGRRHVENWNQPGEDVDFFDLKGDVESLVAWSGEPVSYVPLEDSVLHPGQAAAIMGSRGQVGRLGRLHPEIERALDLPGHVFVFELEADAVLKRARRRHRGLSRFPSVRRDLAVVVGADTPSAGVDRTLREALGEILVDLRIFDVYQGKGIDSNEKSLGIGLTLQHPSATLNDQEIGKYMSEAIDALARDLGAKLR